MQIFASKLFIALGLSALAVQATNHLPVASEEYVRGCKAACAIKHDQLQLGSWDQKPVAVHENLNGFPFHFTSTYAVVALPELVVNANSSASFGQEGGVGWFNYGIDSISNVICFNITISGVNPPFKSPALTSTHIHQAAFGKAGPPRIAFPNPSAVEGRSDILQSVGCFAGPFNTGIKSAEGKDTGEGFTVKQIEADPKGFFTDVHTEAKPDGAVRGQLG